MGILRFLETQFIRIWRRIQKKKKKETEIKKHLDNKLTG